jgi:hypothetical protein
MPIHHQKEQVISCAVPAALCSFEERLDLSWIKEVLGSMPSDLAIAHARGFFDEGVEGGSLLAITREMKNQNTLKERLIGAHRLLSSLSKYYFFFLEESGGCGVPKAIDEALDRDERERGRRLSEIDLEPNATSLTLLQ